MHVDKNHLPPADVTIFIRLAIWLVDKKGLDSSTFPKNATHFNCQAYCLSVKSCYWEAMCEPSSMIVFPRHPKFFNAFQIHFLDGPVCLIYLQTRTATRFDRASTFSRDSCFLLSDDCARRLDSRLTPMILSAHPDDCRARCTTGCAQADTRISILCNLQHPLLPWSRHFTRLLEEVCVNFRKALNTFSKTRWFSVMWNSDKSAIKLCIKRLLVKIY